MADINNLKDKIRRTIYPNGRGAINASDHQAMLLEMADGMAEADTKLTKLSEEIDNLQKGEKFDKQGNYPNLSAGFAENLVGRGESTPAEFTFRASGGKSIKDGAARIKRIKGNSVVWNQKLNYQDLSLSLGELTETDTEIIIVPPSNEDSNRYGTAVDVIDGHYYLQAVEIRSETGGTVGFQNYLHLDIYNKTTSTSYVLLWDIVKAGSSGRAYIQILGQNGAAYRIRKGSFVLRDLTQMFGTGNEPTTIEEFYARIPMGVDLNAYNEGEVIHCNTESIKSVGDNAWDEEWEQGGIFESNGMEFESIDSFRTKNYIRVLPNTQYYFKKPVGVVTHLMFYDDNKNFVIWLDPFATSGEGGGFTTPNAPYMRFVCYESTYNNNVTISLYHSGWKAEKDDQYQPYWEDVLPLPIINKYFPQGMKSAGPAHDDIRFNKASGKWEAVQRIGSVDLGILEWGIDSSGFAYSQNNISAMVDASGVSRSLICASLEIKQEQYWKPTTYDAVMIAEHGKVFITGNILTDTTPMELQDKLQGVILYYELAEPVIREIDEPIGTDYRVADFGTEQAVSSIPSAPFKADIIYQFNAVDMIREHELEITELQKVIATMQAQLTSLINGGQ